MATQDVETARENWRQQVRSLASEMHARGIIERVGRALERHGLLVRDFENSLLTMDPAAVSGFDDLNSLSRIGIKF